MDNVHHSNADMMEKKRILEEGLLEKYIMDDLSVDERESVQIAISQDEELKEKFQLLEADFEKLAFENAIAPKPQVKASLVNQIKKPRSKSSYRFYFAIAASLALLFVLTTFLMYAKWKSAETDFNIIQTKTSSLEKRLQALENNFQLTNAQLQFVNHPQTIPLVLEGNEKAPSFQIVAYINHEDQKVMVNPKKLPELSEDQTYQMWSDVEGEMISMGLLETDKEMIALKYINHAESLNITVEPVGGNDHATVENLISYVTL